MLSKNDFRKAIDIIEKSQRILITSHVKPDGDSCGCTAAFTDILLDMKKEVRPLFLTDIPYWYDFLFGNRPPVLGKDLQVEDLISKDFFDPDLIIIVDTNSINQLGDFFQYLRQTETPALILDHHVTSDGLGTIELQDKSASATGLIVKELFDQASWPLNEYSSRALFISIATDTGWFRFSNTDSRTFNCCADLMKKVKAIDDLYRRLNRNYSLPRFMLMVEMLKTLKFHLDGRYASQHITGEMFDKCGASYSDTENLIDECQKVASVMVASLFTELKEGQIKCSLRSRGEVDVGMIAQKFGGGGHFQAAGTTLDGPLDKAKDLILREVEDQLP